ACNKSSSMSEADECFVSARIERLVKVRHDPKHSSASDMLDDLLHALFELSDVSLPGQNFARARLEDDPVLPAQTFGERAQERSLPRAGVADQKNRARRLARDCRLQFRDARGHRVEHEDLIARARLPHATEL